MPRHLPKSFWFVTLLCILILGGALGIALPQNALTTGIPLALGWLFLPFSLPFPSHVDYATHVPAWLSWLIFLYYPLALLMASACTYWMQRNAWKKRQTFLLLLLFTFIDIIIGIPVSLIAPSLNSNGIAFPVTLSLLLPVWLNLLASAGLGWCIGCLSSKRETAA